MNAPFRIALLGLVGLALAGCPQVPSPDPLPTSPSIASFTASAGQVAAGGTVTLTWRAENATSIRIDELSLGQVSGVAGNEGTVEVSVGTDSVYVLTVRNERGASDSAIVSVKVNGAAREMLLVAVPENIASGQSASLAWNAPGASSVTLTAAPGGVVDIGNQGAAGTVVVSPAVTTTYTLTADGRTRSVTVNVAPEITTLVATVVSGDGGSFIHVAWATSGATRVTLAGTGRGQLTDVSDAAQVAVGSFDEPLPTAVDPGQYFTYELTATAGAGTTRRTVVLAVPGNPAITSFTAPSVARFADGGVVTLAWQTLEAASLSISVGGVELYRAPAANVATGTLQLPTPPTDTEYVLTARAARGGEATASRLVDVVGLPTVTLEATPGTATAGDPVTLSWSGTHLRNVTIREVGYGGVFSATGMQDTGSTTVTPGRDTTYVIDVNNGLGDTATATAQVTVTGGVVLTLSETGALRQGQNVAVSWTAPSGSADITGLPHTTVDVRAGSTGFDDISTTGTALSFTTASASIVTGFRMPLFGTLVGETLQVTQYGFLGFTEINGTNNLPEPLPSPYIEDLVIAPYWYAMSAASVRWQLKTAGNTQVLIVQWDTTAVSVQTKLYATGQIDFEYRTLPSTGTASVGITGRVAGQTIVAPGPAVGQGFTFFGPRPSPATIPVWEESALIGHLALPSGQLLRVGTTIGPVVRPGELVVNEVMANSAAGINGQWAELRSTRTTPLNIDGWSLGLPDGGALPLSGTVPPRGVLVVGATTDVALNDNAGVQVAVPNFDLTGVASLTLQRAGVASTVPLATGAGVALTNSAGPFRYSSTTPAPGDQRCAATSGYGALGQLGTPGVDSHCGFAYDLTQLQEGFFDISNLGTTLTSTSFDSVSFNLDFSSAPVQFFGAPRSSAVVTTNGFVTFESTASTTAYLAADPATAAPNLLVAAFAGDLSSTTTLGGKISVFRAAAGVDPFAAAPHWIVQWTHYYYYYCDDADLNFQIKFFDDGVVELHYGKMLSTSATQCAVDSLASVSAWLENAAGTQALSVNSRALTFAIRSHTAFRYTPR